MSGSLNKVTLIGNLGRDPDIRTTQSGGRVANLNIATSERWRDRDSGENREKTEWHRVVVFSEGLIGIIESYLKKGSKVYLEGQLETRKWTDDNAQERYITEVVLRNFRSTLIMLDSRSSGSPESFGNAVGNTDLPPAARGGVPFGKPFGKEGMDETFDDDDIPF